MTKKQHYVPQMLLKRFAILPLCEKVWEYNLFTKSITLKKLDEICASNYFYEIRDEAGNYLHEAGKNRVEDGFSLIESSYVQLFDELFERLKGGADSIELDNEELEELNVWISFLILRNPLIYNAIVDVAKDYGVNFKGKLDQSYYFINIMPKELEQYSKDLSLGHMQFLKAHKDNGFIIGDIPVVFGDAPLHNFCYTPISKEYAIFISKPKSVLENLNRCDIKTLSYKETAQYNEMIHNAMLNAYEHHYLKGGSIVCHNKDILRKVVFPGLL